MLEHIDILVGVGAADEENLPEALKGVDERKDDGEEHRVPHLRGGDVVELLPTGGPVQVGGGVLVLRDGDKPGQQQNHAVTGVLPEIEQQYHAERRRTAQPIHEGQAQDINNAGDQAAVGKEQLHQDDCPHHRHDVGKQEHGFEQFVLVGVLLHEQGDGIGQYHDQRQRRCQKAHGVPEGQGEHSVGGHVLVVDETNEIARPSTAGTERVLDHQDEGDGVEQEAADKERGD